MLKKLILLGGAFLLVSILAGCDDNASVAMPQGDSYSTVVENLQINNDSFSFTITNSYDATSLYLNTYICENNNLTPLGYQKRNNESISTMTVAGLLKDEILTVTITDSLGSGESKTPMSEYKNYIFTPNDNMADLSKQSNKNEEYLFSLKSEYDKDAPEILFFAEIKP